MKNYDNIASSLYNTPWVIEPEKMNEIESFVHGVMNGQVLTAEQKQELIAASPFTPMGVREETSEISVGLVRVVGTLTNRANIFSAASGGTSYQRIAAQMDAYAADESVDKIVMDFDSPGGTVDGVEVAAEAIRKAAQVKDVIAVVNDYATSGAYWLAAQASKIVITESSSVGSIGVLAIHREYSKQDEMLGVKRTLLKAGSEKGTGNDVNPLSDKDRKLIQSQLDKIHSLFISSVANGRGLSDEQMKVVSSGRSFFGAEAIDLGLADQVGTLKGVLDDLTKPREGDPVIPEENPVTINQTQEEQMENEELRQLVESLSGQVQTLATSVSAMQEGRAAERAEELVDKYVASGTVFPAQRETLIEQAKVNYSFVAEVLAALPKGAAAPVGDRIVEANNGRVIESGDTILSSAEKEVFKAMGILGSDGKIDASRYQLKVDGLGRINNN